MKTIVVKRTFPVSKEILWEVITQREHLKEWYFNFSEDWNLKLNHEFEWFAGDNDSKQWLHRGKFIEIIEVEKLVHTWEYPGYSGTSTLSWELNFIDENKTEIILTHTFNTPFDKNEPALNINNFKGGWDAILNTSLVNYINGLK